MPGPPSVTGRSCVILSVSARADSKEMAQFTGVIGGQKENLLILKREFIVQMMIDDDGLPRFRVGLEELAQARWDFSFAPDCRKVKTNPYKLSGFFVRSRPDGRSQSQNLGFLDNLNQRPPYLSISA